MGYTVNTTTLVLTHYIFLRLRFFFLLKSPLNPKHRVFDHLENMRSSVHAVRNQASRLVCKSRNNYSDRPLVFVHVLGTW